MSEPPLTARSTLNGARHEFDGVTIAEVADRAIVSIATPHGGSEALSRAVNAAYRIDCPGVGQSTLSKVGNTRFLCLQQDQIFALFDHPGPGAIQVIAEHLGGNAYLTDQSDSWVVLSVSGPNCRAALERICPIDLHPAAFADGSVARTVMEHIGAIIVREGPEGFLLISARSSAGSFLHAAETSARNVI